MASLSTWHFGAAALHASLAILVIVSFWGVSGNTGKGRLPLFRTAPDPQSLQDNEAMNYGLQVEPAGTLNLPALLVAFTLVTATAHAANGWSERRSPGALHGRNALRWSEYAISAPIMIVIIAALSGVRLVSELILAAAATAVVMYFGHLVERDPSRFRAHTAAGWALYVPVWVVIGLTFFKHISDAKESGASPPAWLWAVFVTQLVFFSSFGVLQIAHRAGFPKSPAALEKSYLGLSFVSKATLVLLLFAGIAAAPAGEEGDAGGAEADLCEGVGSSAGPGGCCPCPNGCPGCCDCTEA